MKTLFIFLIFISSLLSSCEQAGESTTSDIPLIAYDKKNEFWDEGVKAFTAYLDEDSGLVKFGRCQPVSAFCNRSKSHTVLREIPETDYVTVLADRWAYDDEGRQIYGIDPDFALSEESFESLAREYTATDANGNEVTRTGLIGQFERDGHARAVERYTRIQQRARTIWAIRKFLRADGNMSQAIRFDQDRDFEEYFQPTKKVDDILYPFNFVDDLSGTEQKGRRTDVRNGHAYSLLSYKTLAAAAGSGCDVLKHDELYVIIDWLLSSDPDWDEKTFLLEHEGDHPGEKQTYHVRNARKTIEQEQYYDPDGEEPVYVVCRHLAPDIYRTVRPFPK